MYHILCYDHKFPKGKMCQVECFKRIIVCWWVAWAVNFSFGGCGGGGAGVLGIWGEWLFIFRELGSTGDYFPGFGE